jgi:hypothetical protein
MVCAYAFPGEDSGVAEVDASSQGYAVALPELNYPDDIKRAAGSGTVGLLDPS